MHETYDITLDSGLKGAKVKKVVNPQRIRGDSWFYVSLAGQIGYTIAIPVVLGAGIGNYFSHAIIGIVIGTGISIIGFVRVVKKLL